MDDHIYCFDIDGTLLDHKGFIHSRDVNILSKFGAYNLVVTTGRSRESVRKTFNRNGLFLDTPIPISMVLLNGSLVYAPHEQLIFHNSFSSEIQNTLTLKAQSFSEITFLLLDIDNIYMINSTIFGDLSCKQFSFDTIIYENEHSLKSFSKLMCISQDLEKLLEFSSLTADLPVERAMSMETVLEITPSGQDKRSGLKRLLLELEFDAPLIFTAGDGGNDLPLFDLTYFSFAPDTAPPEIIKRVNFIINWDQSGIIAPMFVKSNFAPVGNRDIYYIK